MLKIHDYICPSHSNGPGARAVIWTQGCNLACRGCFNPATHPADKSNAISPSALARKVLQEENIEGVTVSGGEPFQQFPALEAFLHELKSRSKLSIIVFSGYSLEEILQLHPASLSALRYIDVLIAGRYVENRRVASGLIGSSNKVLHFFSNRYTCSDFKDVPEAEVFINADGSIIMTGIDPLSVEGFKAQ